MDEKNILVYCDQTFSLATVAILIFFISVWRNWVLIQRVRILESLMLSNLSLHLRQYQQGLQGVQRRIQKTVKGLRWSDL